MTAASYEMKMKKLTLPTLPFSSPQRDPKNTLIISRQSNKEKLPHSERNEKVSKGG
jgi:hypothetical protein